MDSRAQNRFKNIRLADRSTALDGMNSVSVLRMNCRKVSNSTFHVNALKIWETAEVKYACIILKFSKYAICFVR